MGMQLQQQQQQQQQAQYNMQPTIFNFKSIEKMPDGSQHQVSNSLTINVLDQSMDSGKQVTEICQLLNSGDNDQAYLTLNKLKEQGKIQYQIQKNQIQN